MRRRAVRGGWARAVGPLRSTGFGERVAGNHDLFGGDEGLAGLRAEEGIHVLDGDRVHADGLRIAGVGGITGNKRKPNRRPADAFVAAVRDSLAGRPDLVVLHEGPSGGERCPAFRTRRAARRTYEAMAASARRV